MTRESRPTITSPLSSAIRNDSASPNPCVSLRCVASAALAACVA